jgi:hypothetical protein
MAMTVAFAPLSVIAADKEKSGEPPPPTAADFAKLQREGGGAAVTDHPDDAGRTAAL